MNKRPVSKNHHVCSWYLCVHNKSTSEDLLLPACQGCQPFFIYHPITFSSPGCIWIISRGFNLGYRNGQWNQFWMWWDSCLAPVVLAVLSLTVDWWSWHCEKISYTPNNLKKPVAVLLCLLSTQTGRGPCKQTDEISQTVDYVSEELKLLCIHTYKFNIGMCYPHRLFANRSSSYLP